MDFFKKLSDSLKFTFKHKVLWGFGFLIGLLGLGLHYNFPVNLNDRSGVVRSLQSNYTDAYDRLNNIVHTPSGLLLLAVILLITVLVAFLMWYITSISRAGLIRAVLHDQQHDPISFSRSWHEGGHFAIRLMALDLAIAIITLVLFVPAIILLVISAVLPVILCCTVPLFVIYALAVTAGVAITHTAAERYLVIKNAGVLKSINVGMVMAQKHLSDFILGFLVSLLPGCAWAIIMIVVGAVLLIPSAIASAAIFQGQPLIALSVAGLAALFSTIVTAFVNAPYIVFTNTYWTKVVMEFIKD